MSSADAYRAANPLGGPAAMFRTIAERLEAGEDYQAVLADYGLAHSERATPSLTAREALEEAARICEQMESAQRGWQKVVNDHAADIVRDAAYRIRALAASLPAEPSCSGAVAEKRRMQGCCIDCGRKYGDEYGFPDLVVPNEAWKRFSPTGDEGGLLCPSCMIRRAHEAGVRCEAHFSSGPFRLSDNRAYVLDAIRAFKDSGQLPVPERATLPEGLLTQCRLILESRNDNIVMQGYLNVLADMLAAAPSNEEGK